MGSNMRSTSMDHSTSKAAVLPAIVPSPRPTCLHLAASQRSPRATDRRECPLVPTIASTFRRCLVLETIFAQFCMPPRRRNTSAMWAPSECNRHPDPGDSVMLTARHRLPVHACSSRFETRSQAASIYPFPQPPTLQSAWGCSPSSLGDHVRGHRTVTRDLCLNDAHPVRTPPS
jgi:hypothetical protein